MKRIAALAVLIVGLAGLSLVAVPLLLSPEALKQRMAERITSITGRGVTLAGVPSLSIYPHVALGVSGVTIGNSEGGGDDPFIVAKALSARLRLLPLLLGRTEFDAFELTEPRIRLVVDKDGKGNWRLQPSRVRPAAGGMALGRLLMTNGTIVYDNIGAKQHEEATDVDLDITWPTAASAATGSGTLKWRGETVEFNGAVTRPLDLIAGTGSPLRFGIAATPLRVSFNGKAQMLDEASLEGEASVTSPSLRRAVEWLGTPTGNGSILGPASIRGTMTLAGATVSLAKASVELDGNSAEGALTMDLAGGRPAVTGTLALEKLDLSPYLDAVRADIGAQGPWLFAPTSLPGADAFDADLRLSVGEVLLGTLRFGKAAMTTTIRDGRATVDIGEAEFYGGKLEVSVAAGMDGEALGGSVSARVSSVPAKAALTGLIAVSGLAGMADGTLQVSGRGKSWGEFAQSISGSAAIEVSEGSVTGVDVGEIAAKMLDPLAEPLASGNGATAFSRFAGTIAIEGSALRANDLVAEGSGYRVALAGRGSLLTGAVDGKATLWMKDAAGSTRETIPLAISGSWRAPVIAPDQGTNKSENRPGASRG